jgi:hypothetical protein
MTKKEQENVLTKEIESWISSEYSLREQDRILFNKIVNECQKESKALTAKDEYNSAESLFMALIFQQQKIISKLIDKLSNIKENKKRFEQSEYL